MSLQFSNYTEPIIVTNGELNHRSYITFYFKNEIQKQYHGKNVGLKINPNRAKSLDENNSYLRSCNLKYTNR
jgi:hypothetical protein